MGSRGVKSAWLQDVAVTASCRSDPWDSRPGLLLANRRLTSRWELEFFFSAPANFTSRPESRQGYPPNLSILISGGKENNSDALSNGE